VLQKPITREGLASYLAEMLGEAREDQSASPPEGKARGQPTGPGRLVSLETTLTTAVSAF